MTDTMTERGLGDNQPKGAVEQLAARIDELVDTANRWLKERPEITAKEHADRLEGFLGQARAAEKDAEAARKDDNRPHAEAVAANNARYAPLTTKLKVIADLLKPKLEAWLRKERARIDEEKRVAAETAAAAQRAAEEAARKAKGNQTVENVIAAEAAAETAAAAIDTRDAAAAAKPAAKSEFSSRSRGLRKVRRAEVTDQDAAYQHYRTHQEVRDVLFKLANQDARRADGPAAVPGVSFFEETVLG